VIVKEHFDVIVVGADLAPLLAAALLCKRGFRVLVVGAGEPAADRVPAVTGELESPVARRVLSELGIAQIVKRKEQAIDPLFQIVTPGCRISVPADAQRLLSEFAREMPREKEAARMFYADLDEALGSIDSVLDSGAALPPRGFIERQRVRRMLSSTPFGLDGLGGRLLEALADAPHLRSCVYAHVVPSSRLDRRQIAPVHAALLHGRAVRRQVALEGGLRALREILLQRITTSRGEAKLQDRLEEVVVRGGRVVQVKLAGQESATGCDFLVAGVEMSSIAPLLRQDGRRVEESPVPGGDLHATGYRATMRLVLRDDVFPEPLARLVHVLFDESGPPVGSNLAVLERGAMDEDAGALWVSFIVDGESARGDPRAIDEVASAVRRRLRRVVPFIDGSIREVRGPLDGVRPEELEMGPEPMLARHLEPVYRSPDPGPWGACGLGYTSRIRNLLVCSRQVLPGLGAEGPWMAAWGASGLIARRDPSKARWKSRMKRL
jgi:phytoene dehydrogenase-like protein